MIFNLSDRDSVASQFLMELRDVNLQKDRARFRRNVERLGQILAYEISKTLPYKMTETQTPVSKGTFKCLDEMPVLITILRAGMPFLQGFLNVFDQSDCGFIGAYRQENPSEIEIKMDYTATPVINNRAVILIDPMLATGKSAVRVMKHLLSKESVKCIHLASVISSPEGIQFVRQFAKGLACPVGMWTGAIDQGLNEKYYIVPGLGDAGDLSFGTK